MGFAIEFAYITPVRPLCRPRGGTQAPGGSEPPGRSAELRRGAAASALVSVGSGRARRAAAGGGEGGSANRTFLWAGWDGRTDGRAHEMNEQMWTIEKWLNNMS